MNQAMKSNTPNVVLITVDALRYDHLSCYGYYRNTTPNIDALAARGVKFLQAVSNGGQTPQAFPSILASALPPLQRPRGKKLLQGETLLAELFRKAGYSTCAIHSNPCLSRFYGYDRGFDTFDDRVSGLSLRGARLRLRAWHPPDTLIGKIRARIGKSIRPVMRRVAKKPIVTADETTGKAVAWLKSHHGKVFMWLHYMDVHNPYLPPARYASCFLNNRVGRQRMINLNRKMIDKPQELSKDEVDTIISLYDAEVRSVDEAVGKLLDELEDHVSNTFVILTADHGDEFGEHGRFSHNTVYDGILRVPLIITGPGINGGTIVKGQVSLIDLAPTIMELLGIKSPLTFHGKNLLPIIRDEKEIETETISTYVDPVVERRNIAYRTPGWKYICNETLDGGSECREEVYNLANDPREIRNLHGRNNEQADRFEIYARGKIARFRQSKIEEATGYQGKEIRAKIGMLKKSGKI